MGVPPVDHAQTREASADVADVRGELASLKEEMANMVKAIDQEKIKEIIRGAIRLGRLRIIRIVMLI